MIIRVLLVDDHPMICRGIRSTLKAESDVAVIAEAGTVEEGMRLACELQPDVVVMGVQFPDGNGIEACRQIRKYCASSVVLILTAFDRDDYLAQAWEAGAAGFILKSVTMDELAKEVRQAGDRQPVWMPEQLQRIHTWQEEVEEPLRRLTAREMDVLRLVAAGHTNSQIASGLAITVKTVECYVTKIMKKLGFTTRLDIIRWVKHAKALGTLQDGSGPAFEFSVFPDRQ